MYMYREKAGALERRFISRLQLIVSRAFQSDRSRVTELSVPKGRERERMRDREREGERERKRGRRHCASSIGSVRGGVALESSRCRWLAINYRDSPLFPLFLRAAERPTERQINTTQPPQTRSLLLQITRGERETE